MGSTRPGGDTGTSDIDNKTKQVTMPSQNSSQVASKKDWIYRWYTSINTDRPRFQREFFNPEPTLGNYYPRFQATGLLESASVHVPFLGRSYFSYKVPSVYGYSKFITVRKQ